MLEFIFDLPLIITGPAIVGSLCLFAIGGMLLVRRHVLPRLRIQHEDAHFSGAMVHSVMVFYGLALALIAVNVFETYSDVSKVISQEATALATLYRDVSAYPEPKRSQLQKELRDYVDYVIHEAWPLQQRGQVPSGGVQRINSFQGILVTFEPATHGQESLHAETLRAYNNMIQARRLRLDSVGTGLPGVMWIVVLVGAVISLGTSFFFKVDDVRLHGILVTLLAMFIGLVIFMTFALDRPFRGDLGVRPEPYQLIYDQLMKP
jgi:membrane protein YdbS with pleckstrin-like domain